MDGPIEIHYAKLEEWLVDRSPVIKKKHGEVYKFVERAAPILVQKVKYDLPATKKSVTRAEVEGKEAASSIGESIKSAELMRKKRRELLIRYNLLDDEDCDEETIEASISSLTEKVNLAAANAAVRLHCSVLALAQAKLLNPGEEAENSPTPTSPLRRALAEFGKVCQGQLDQVQKEQALYSSKPTCSTTVSSSTAKTEGGDSASSAVVMFPWLSLVSTAAEARLKGSNCKGGVNHPSNEELDAAVEQYEETLKKKVFTEFGVKVIGEGKEEEDQPTIDIDWGDDDDDAGMTTVTGGGHSSTTGGVAEADAPQICLDLDDLDLGGGQTHTMQEKVETVDKVDAADVTVVSVVPPKSFEDLFIFNEKQKPAIIDELHGLIAFLKEQEFQERDVSSFGGNLEQLKKHRIAVERILGHLDSKESEVENDLLRMHYSHRHMEKFLRTIEQLGFNATQKTARVEQLQAKIEVAATAKETAKPELDLMIDSIRKLKVETENQLGKVFKPRIVRLVGDVANV